MTAFGRQFIGLGLSTALGVLATQSLMSSGLLRTRRLFTVLVGSGLGLGLSSLIWFIVWCGAAPGWPLLPIAAEVATLLLLVRCQNTRTITSRRKRDSAPNVKWIAILGAFSFAGAVFFFVHFMLHAPFGGWDAWAIWNLHARALFVGGGRFWHTELFKISWSHPDYPLLIPLNVARLWFFTGSDSASAPAMIAFLYTFGTAGVLATGLSQLKNRVSGTLALATLLASTKFLALGLQEYADVPQSFYLLTALVTLAEYELSGEVRFLILTGLSSGFAIWTKNEGWMFLGCLIAARLILFALSRWWRISPGNAVPFFIGLLPVLAVAVIYKLMNPAHSDVLSWYLTKSGWMRVFEVKRLLFILENFGRVLWHLNTWFVSSTAILLVYAGLLGFEKNKTVRKAGVTGLFTIGLMLLGYFCVFATSTADLNWYLNTSLERLYLQLWPSFLFSIFLITRTPYSRSANGSGGEDGTIVDGSALGTPQPMHTQSTVGAIPNEVH